MSIIIKIPEGGWPEPKRIFYHPRGSEIAIAHLLAKWRRAYNNGQSNLPNGETMTQDERYHQDFAAVLAEIAVSHYTNLCWTGITRGGGLSPNKDVGNLLEVRAITNSKRGLLVRWKDDFNAPFVLVHVDDTGVCEIKGWAYGTEVWEKGFCLDEDTSKPCWILPSDKLGLLDDLECLILDYMTQGHVVDPILPKGVTPWHN